MNKNFQEKINRMVKNEYRKQLNENLDNEMKIMGREFTIDDVKRAAIAAGLSAAIISGLIHHLKNESDEDADMEAYEQSDEGREERQNAYDLINGVNLQESIRKSIRKSLKHFC